MRIALLLAFLSTTLLAADVSPTLDAPPGPNQKPYAPADNQVVEVTPPPFIWLPAGKDARYILQVSPSDQFPKETTRTFANLRRCVFVPKETLPAGKWFWRYGIETASGTTFGRVRPFTIPDSARPFPFPEFEQVIKNIPSARPRLFFPGQRLEQIRQAARGELKEDIERLARACEKSIGEELVPEPGYRPKEPDKYGPWAVNIMRTTRPPMDAMERCALAYLVTGERKFGLEAKRRLLYFFSWDPEGPTSFFAYDEPPMWVMMRGTRAYDWTYDLFTAEERAKIEPNMKARALQFLKQLNRLPFESNPYNSHAGRLPGFLGECAISFIHEWPEARQWLEYVTLLYCTSYPAWGGDDGGWHEGPMYWSAYMGMALHYVTALRHASGVDLMQKPFFRNTPYYGLYTATPYHEHSPFGDGSYGKPSAGHIAYAFSSLLKDPYLRWYAEAAGYKPGADVLSLANYDPSIKAKPPTDLPQARIFPGAGLASIHTALGDKEHDISFLLRSSPLGSVSHGHADQNAFTIEAFGKALAIATGYYPWYGSPHHSKWTRSTRAVNSILVNNEGQTQRSGKAAGRIVTFKHTPEYTYIEAEAGPAYGGKLEKFRRHVLQLNGNAFVIFDDLVAARPSTFQWLLHSPEEVHVDEQSRQMHVNRGFDVFMHAFLPLPRDIQISQTDRYVPEPEDVQGKWSNTWHLTASTKNPAIRTQFLAVLNAHDRNGSPGPCVQSVQPLNEQGAVGARIQFRDSPFPLIVGFRTDPAAKTIKCGNLTTDARIFAYWAVSKKKLLIDGTFIEEGKPR